MLVLLGLLEEVLEAPQTSELTRKRKVDSNPPIGKRRARGQGSSEPKSVNPKDRVNEFPDECLRVNRGGKLFCGSLAGQTLYQPRGKERVWSNPIHDLVVHSQQSSEGGARL